MRESTKDRFMMEAAMEACYAHNGGVEIMEVEPRFPKENDMCSRGGECTMRPFTQDELDAINKQLDLAATAQSHWYETGFRDCVEHQKRIMAELDRRMD